MRSDDRLFVIVFLAILGLVAAAAVLPRVLAGGRGTAAATVTAPGRPATAANREASTAGGGSPGAGEPAAGRPGAVRAVGEERSAPAGPAALRATLEELLEPRFLDVLPPADRLLDELSGALRQMADGEVPRSLAQRLGPFREVLVREDGEGRLVLAAGTRRRYRPVVELVESLDPGAVAAAVSELTPLLRDVSDGAASAAEAEAVVGRALDHLLDVHVPGGPVEMEQRATRYVFAEDHLRALSPMQQHLVLMGPDNAERIQAVLTEVRAALGGDDRGDAPRAAILASAAPPVRGADDASRGPARASGSGREVIQRPTAP